jgi:mono/diheme cytochrome c family protein
MHLRTAFTASLALSFAAFIACSSSAPTASGTADVSSISALEADGGLAARGATLVNQLGCHGCHDSTAGVMAGNNAGVLRRVGDAGLVRVYPANLTPDSKSGLGTAEDGWSDTQIARAIRTGVDDQCLTLCKVMPHFNLSDADMAAVTAYLRSLTPVSNDVSNQGCPTLDPSVSGGGQFVDAGSCPAPEESDAGSP